MSKRKPPVFNAFLAPVTRGLLLFVEDESVLATCMIIPKGNHVWEVCKLAANEKYKGHGAGSAVFKACMDYAIEHGAEKLTLVSNHILEPALHIYEKFGFKRVNVDNSEFDRADVQCEFIVLKDAKK